MKKDRFSELENLRIEIWKSAATIEDEKQLIQDLLDKAGPVLGSENISFMPYGKDSEEIVVEMVWRSDGSKIGIGDHIPSWIFKHLNNKAHLYFSFDNIPDVLKPVLIPFLKKYRTKSSLVIPYGSISNPKGFISSQTYNFSKTYTESEINVFIEISKIIYLKSNQIKSKIELSESRQRFKNLTEQTNEALIIHKDGIVLDINLSAEKMFGFKRKKALKRSLFEFIPKKYHEIVKRRMKAGKTDLFELELIRNDGTTFIAETIGKRGIFKDENVRVISVNNITDRKTAEKEILRLSAIVEQSPISVIITDLNGTIEYANPQSIKITGYERSELIGRNPSVLATGHTSKDEYKILWKTILSGKIWRGEFLNKRKDGSKYWERAIIAPVLNDKNEIVNFVGLKTDISERKENEQKLRAFQDDLKEAVIARDKLFTIISHDLRSPFSSILGFSEIMLNKSKQKEFDDFEDMSKYIYQSAKQSFELLDNLLQWSRIQTGRIKFSPEKFNLREITNNIVELFRISADEKQISFMVNIDKGAYVKADMFMIETIIRNLISNAIKFTPRGGEIIINCEKKNQDIYYSVSDTGIGINDDNLKNLFRIETGLTTLGTASEKGSGIGLILCKEFLDYHKGSINVKSEIGKGSTFTACFPETFSE